MLLKYILFVSLLINLLSANVHRYDDSRYLQEINEERYDNRYQQPQEIIDDEYRGSMRKVNNHQPHRPSTLPLKRVTPPKRYILQNGVRKFSDEDQLKIINKDEFDEINTLSKDLAIPYNARIKVEVNIASQRMSIYANGKRYYRWKVSTGRWKYPTPRGYYRPQFLKRMHYSKKYDNAPMPHSVFFKGGYAIHGTNSISRLGRKASHGCIRLHPRNAKKLFGLIKSRGKHNISIVVR